MKYLFENVPHKLMGCTILAIVALFVVLAMVLNIVL